MIVEKFNLLAYTLDDDNRIFIRTIDPDSRLVAILGGHHAVPSIALAEDQLILISGDSTKNSQTTVNICTWRLYDAIIMKIWSSRILKGIILHKFSQA